MNPSAVRREYEHASEKLEFDCLLELVGAYARSERSREAIAAFSRISSVSEIERRQGEVAELLALMEEGEALFPAGWRDSWEVLQSVNVEGMAAGGEDLAAIAAGELAAIETGGRLEKHMERCSLLSAYRGGISGQQELVSRISRTIGPDFEVTDTASKILAGIRRQTDELRKRLRKEFADFAGDKGGGKGYEFVTVRGERYVIALPRGTAAGIKGIVHQASGSGASLFVEPLEFVESNNKLESLLEEERREIQRILRELTSEVFRLRDVLIANQNTLLSLDVLSAMASFAKHFHCTRPAHSPDGTLILAGARHPLLEKRLAGDTGEGTITPLDLVCGPELKTLVISGPNAGGKTVALKTTGLLLMMDGAGMLLPCREGTVLPAYGKLFVDIGDDQSIERSLSTFSSRIERLKGILELADTDSLVLIDEIGDGTDPEEGAALAEAVLERLTGKGARTIVTTHLRALKGWAHGRGGAINATLEFDSERLEPLYRLKMGVPGRSWGIEMAGRLGLDPGIVDSARMCMDADAVRMEELLAHLERTELLVNRQREELIKREQTLGELIKNYREKINTFQRDQDDMVEEARREALEIVSSTRREMENLVREIRSTQAERAAIRNAKDQLQKRKDEFEQAAARRGPVAPVRPEDIHEGTWYEIISLGQPGRVIVSDGAPRVTLELKGGLRVETRVDDLAPAGDIPRPAAGGRVSWTADSFEPVTSELMIRGLERVDALDRVDNYIDRAVLQGMQTVTIIHGVGKGVLKRAIYDMLKKDPRVADVHPGEPARGGDGVAIVHLK